MHAWMASHIADLAHARSRRSAVTPTGAESNKHAHPQQLYTGLVCLRARSEVLSPKSTLEETVRVEFLHQFALAVSSLNESLSLLPHTQCVWVELKT